MSQLAGWIKVILTECVGRSVYVKLIALLFLLATLCGCTDYAGSQESGLKNFAVFDLWYN